MADTPDGDDKHNSEDALDFEIFPLFPVSTYTVRLECPIARPLSRLKAEGAREEHELKAIGADVAKNGPQRIPGFEGSPGRGIV